MSKTPRSCRDDGSDPQLPAVRCTLAEADSAAPPLFTLRDGPLCLELAADGRGHLQFGEEWVTRASTSPLGVPAGPFLYLYDREAGQYWSATWSPTCVGDGPYDCRATAKCIEVAREEWGIRTLTTFCLLGSATLIVRCTLQNTTPRPRTLELTTFQELALQAGGAYRAHPAFSRLFVETKWDAELQVLSAQRRARDPDRTHVACLHGCLEASGATMVEYDSARATFLGRGRGPRYPIGLASASLTGTVGTVLDPAFMLRCACNVAPGEMKTVTFATTVGAPDTIGETWAAIDREQLEAQCGDPQRRLDDAWRQFDESSQPTLVVPPWPPMDQEGDPAPFEASGDLELANAYGGFADEGREYHIRLPRLADGTLRRTPQPWCNVVSRPEIGFIASESGALSTWSGNSRQHRLTEWHNDPTTDPGSEFLFLRDRDDPSCQWTALPYPMRAATSCHTRHGMGFTEFRSEHTGLRQEVILFVPVRDRCRVARLRLTNVASRTRRLACCCFHVWTLADVPGQAGEIEASWKTAWKGIVARSAEPSPYCNGIPFATLLGPAHASAEDDGLRWWTDADVFLGAPHLSQCPGPHGNPFPAALSENATAPRGSDQPDVSEAATAKGAACAAIERWVDVEPGQTVELVYLLGDAREDEIRTMVAEYASPDGVEHAFQETCDLWRELAERVQVTTPCRELDVLVNGWLVYQNVSCRLWGRSSYYQGGGAFGYRDQLQDASAFYLQWPQLTREQILLHAAHQFPEGDVLHWWHPPHGLGIRTRFADDLLWLPLLTCEYVAASGDAQVWDEPLPFVGARGLQPGEDEALVETTPLPDGTASLFEHCARAVDRSLVTGMHGLPLFGTGDWNDGMNRVGRRGVGESVWMGFFLSHILEQFLPVVTERGDEARVQRYAQSRTRLVAALNSVGWDGHWFLRAFHDDGHKLGSKESQECQIDALVQAWSVLSGAGEPDKQRQAMQAVEDRLVDEDLELIRLLTPPFHHVPYDPGYIKGYLPGLRENGGQYTHGILWFVRAMARLGKGARATQLLQMILPSRLGRRDNIGRYQTEPYVVAADVYSVHPHAGRGGWTWYTGSAGWMFRVAVEDILGITAVGGCIWRVDPRIPPDWPEYRVALRCAESSTEYAFHVTNPERREAGVGRVHVDGAALPVVDGVAEIPRCRDGRHHVVDIELGPPTATTTRHSCK